MCLGSKLIRAMKLSANIRTSNYEFLDSSALILAVYCVISKHYQESLLFLLRELVTCPPAFDLEKNQTLTDPIFAS